MSNYLCTHCGHRKMEKDSRPSPEKPKVEFMMQLVLISAWARLLELELVMQKKRLGKEAGEISPEDEKDYKKLREWWSSVGSAHQNQIKNFAFIWSQKLEISMQVIQRGPSLDV